jgi:hypothetical protein
MQLVTSLTSNAALQTALLVHVDLVQTVYVSTAAVAIMLSM